MSALAMRHDLLAIGIVDPREFDVPPIGLVTFSDPSTGATREVMVTADVQRRFADRAAERRVQREQTVRASGSDWLELSTDRRLAHRDRRTRAPTPAAPGDGSSMSWDFLAPGRLWLLVLVAGLVVAYVFAQRRRAVNTVRFTQIEMLEQIAPRRPGWRRHAVAGVQLAALTIGVLGAAQPVRAFDGHALEGGRQDHAAVRRVAVDGGRRRRSESAGCGQEGRRGLRRCRRSPTSTSA